MGGNIKSNYKYYFIIPILILIAFIVYKYRNKIFKNKQKILKEINLSQMINH